MKFEFNKLMKFDIKFIYTTAIYLAIKRGYTEIVKYLLVNDKIDVNKITIFIKISF